ncbi:SDR family NAD(P)-dependent oxidoreductase [Roseiterribacter gracilis]|uniref:L-xylulose reductase n=1 Tax=Roseiterribacter gracilis TaxID=2812848 RepID=A0A8S8XE78_9PROT|nr:L-xylulose reductase [Rhodospirillales bacterium TMPK1]
MEIATVLVTGAGRGIGRACALALADAGMRVLALARSGDELAQLAAERSQQIVPVPGDVCSDATIDMIASLPRLDALVNNAGGNAPRPMRDVDDATLDWMLALNVRAAYRVARAAAAAIERSGRGGSIVHMSSQMGHVGAANRTVYCMTKHAIEGLTKAMAVELAPQKIRVNSVAPTFVDTPLTRPMLEDPAFRALVLDQIPLGRLARDEEIAAAVRFLVSNESAMVTGTSLKVDGGWTAR